MAAPFPSSAVLVVDGRGETTSHLSGHARADGSFEPLAATALPHSLGLMYEELTDHLGFRRSSDEYKVMAMAAYGRPRFLAELRDLVRTTDAGGFETDPIEWDLFAPRLDSGDDWTADHADLAASVQTRLEEALIDLARWLYAQTGERALTMAGGVALNCVANARILRDGPFDDVWVQPASGDSGTALGAALWASRELGDMPGPVLSAALGREWDADALARWLDAAGVSYEQPDDIAEVAADVLASDGIVAWFQGRSEFGPRALGHRSLLADARNPANLERLNDVKGREQFRPVAPMVLEERAAEIFSGRQPSPFMLFTHDVAEAWEQRIPAVVHVDGTARIQTVDRGSEPLLARMLDAFERRTGTPVVVNTSLNTAGRPMVDDPRDALECFGSAPIDLLALGPFAVHRREHAGFASRQVGEVVA
jgi:carbamoyltransferase